MEDRGEKIVRLAREMLQNRDMQPSPLAPLGLNEKSEKTITLKRSCLTAILAALGSAGLTHLVHEECRPINRYERVEIDALVFYAAKRDGQTEASLRGEIQTELALGTLQDLSVFDYRRVRNYLWTRANS